MKTSNWRPIRGIALLILLCQSEISIRAQLIPTNSPGGAPTNWLNSWTFSNTNWLTQRSNAPVAFTNLLNVPSGDGYSLLLDSADPAFLQYNVIETNGQTNLTVDQGSLSFWFSPDWVSVSQGGTGPGLWGRFIEVGAYTTNATNGWWSLYADPGGSNIYFSVQPGDGSTTTYLTAPISWTNRSWHFVALTYSVTNTALYLDGWLATNGDGLTGWPGSNVLSNGFFIGSDATGINQAQGGFDDLVTWNVAWDAGTIGSIFNEFYPQYFLSPENIADFAPAPFTPSTNFVTPDVITGPGYLSWLGTSGTCVTSSNVWLTNMSATATTNGTTFTFTIAGGTNGLAYDVFATSALEYPITNAIWTWMGQGYSCNTYALSNLSSAVAIFILGTPQDSDNNGLTDAYERLVTHTNPYVDDQDGSGLSDGWQVLLGLNPLINQVAQPGTRVNYTYDLADRFTNVSGIKIGTVSLDNEGNVLSVSQ